MYIKIGCTNGTTYMSDDIPEADVLDEIIGNGDLAGQALTVDDVIELMTEVVVSDDLKNARLTLTINGNERTFKASAVLWIEAVRDKTDS